MNNEMRLNFKEKLRLLSDELVVAFESDFEVLLRRHSSEGMLRSGKTIKSTIALISSLHDQLYTEVLTYIDILKLEYCSSLESEVSELVENTLKYIEPKMLSVFQKSTKIAGKPELYERLLPDVINEESTRKATFQNQLNLKVLQLKSTQTKSPLEKTLWVIEIAMITSLIFISGMWFSDPEGNYEPLFAGLSLLVPFLYLLIRRNSTP